MLASAIINRARLMVYDLTATYRFSDANMIIFVNDAVDALITRRPDLVMDDAETVKALADATLTSSTIDLPNSTTEAMAHFVAYRALQMDSADTANAEKAEQHYQEFLRNARGL